MSGSLFLVPTYLSENNSISFLAPTILEIVRQCDFFLVENIRSARRFISSLKLGISIEDLHFEVLDKKTSWNELYALFDPVREGGDVCLISEAGVPCLADPGNIAVAFAHQTGLRVIPLPGSSSVQLALMGSGFNGQQFTFNGYLPIEKEGRLKKIRELEKLAAFGHTQLFMETPYRNLQLFEDIIMSCKTDTLLSVASDLTGEKEKIKTFPISKWKKGKPDIHKVPSIFSFGQFP